MATNKHAIIRYRVIDKCLRQVDRSWNWKTLSEACAKELFKVTGKKTTLSERTIKGDLQNMRMDEALGYFAPIEYDRKEKSYYYSRRDYSITESPLNKSDSNELKNAISLLRQFTGFRHLEGIENIIQKLELLAYESATKEERIVHLAQPAAIPGQIWLDKIYDSIKKKKSLLLNYKPFDRKASTYIVSPYVLKEYNNRWYVYACNHEKDQLRTYGLERITELKSSISEFKENENFDPDTYFSDIIGITLIPGRKIKKVQFEVYGNTIQYIKTKALHHTQQLISEDSHKAIFQIEIIPNFELETMLLSFGETLKVIKPAGLVGSLKKRSKSLSELYNS